MEIIDSLKEKNKELKKEIERLRAAMLKIANIVEDFVNRSMGE